MKITKHAQSCFLLETKKGSRVLIDPGKFVFAGLEGLKNTDPEFTNIDVLVITHEHSDHFNEDTLEIIRREKPVIFTTPKVAGMITEETLQECKLLPESVSIGPLGKGDVYVTGVDSVHGALPSGQPAPEVDGAIVDDGEVQFYTPGDTVELKNTGADVVAVPIGGTVTTDIKSAKEQISKFKHKPELLIPMHIDNPSYYNDPKEFAKQMAEIDVEVEVLENGDCLEIS